MEHDEAIQVIKAITAGFDGHDLDGILSHFADDAVYESPRGSEPWGQRHVGKPAIREAFAGRFSATETTRTSSTVTEAHPSGPCLARRLRASE